MQDIALQRFDGSGRSKIERFALFRPGLAVVLVGVSYYVGARIGFALTFEPHTVSTLWPPNSILLAALVLAPFRWWWRLLLAVFPAHLLIQLQSGVPLPMMFCWFVSNSSEALIGAYCLRYLIKGQLRLDSIRQVAIFVFVSLFAPFVSSFLDAGFVILNGWGTVGYWQIWRLRFASNVLTEMIIVPLIVMWGADRLAAFRGLSIRRALEQAALALALLFVSFFVFSWSLTSNTHALLYAPLPILLWAAVRFGPKGLNLSLALVTFMAIWSAVHGTGPFIENSPEENALSIQLFLILISMPLMFLAAVIQELDKAREKAKQNEERLTLALSAAQLGTWDWHIPDSVTKWSVETKRMFGFSANDPEVPPDTFYSMLHPDDRSYVEDSINRSIDEATPYEAEFRMPQPDGSVRWIRGKGKVLLDQGRPERMIGVNADITKEKTAEMQLRRTHQQVRVLAGRLINAQEAERHRVSRELHDDLSQRVASLSVTLSRLKRKLPEQSEILPDVNELYKQANNLGNDIRQLSHQLHPVTLEHLGLVGALEEYLGEFERETGISTSFTARVNTRKIAFEISVCLYRIALEALKNVAKHSDTAFASIVLEEHDQVLTMTIVDSGRGFDLEAAKRGSGIGLVSAEERVKLFDGAFEVKSRPGEGTKLTATIALR